MMKMRHEDPRPTPPATMSRVRWRARPNARQNGLSAANNGGALIPSPERHPPELGDDFAAERLAMVVSR